MPLDTSQINIFENLRGNIVAILTPEVDAFLLEADRNAAMANLLLTGLINVADQRVLRERLAAQVQEIQGKRKEQYGNGPYLFVKLDGTTEDIVPEHSIEVDQFFVGIGQTSRATIRSEREDEISVLLNAISLSLGSLSAIKKVAGEIVFFRDDNEPVYIYTALMGGTVVVSNPIPEAALHLIAQRGRYLGKDKILDRVLRLLTSSLEKEEDQLRSFLACWNALEIFVNKVFHQYEQELFAELQQSKPQLSWQKYLNRVKDVMNDKYRLADKFALLNFRLSPESADEDLVEFNKAKKFRDDLSHGQDVSEQSLPVRNVQFLLRKYVQLHIDHRQISSN